MGETPQDLQQLQALLDANIERAGAFLRRSFGILEHSLSAAQLIEVLDGSLTVALATTTGKGEPRAAPTSTLFYRGAFHVPTVAASARPHHASKRPSA